MDAFSDLQEPRRFFADVHRIVIVIPVSSGFSGKLVIHFPKSRV